MTRFFKKSLELRPLESARVFVTSWAARGNNHREWSTWLSASLQLTIMRRRIPSPVPRTRAAYHPFRSLPKRITLPCEHPPRNFHRRISQCHPLSPFGIPPSPPSTPLAPFYNPPSTTTRTEVLIPLAVAAPLPCSPAAVRSEARSRLRTWWSSVRERKRRRKHGERRKKRENK